uniref:CTCK domain-containing protein n=1 Tax=Anabas testudineus TaxID=64144 RepID=A0A3Q1IHT8_ANATE
YRGPVVHTQIKPEMKRLLMQQKWKKFFVYTNIFVVLFVYPTKSRKTHPNFYVSGPDQSQVGCRELRSTKYISDGQCTSVNPIKELVCAGECLPTHLLPNWIGGGSYNGRYWSRRDAQEWRCVIDRTRTQRIRLQCQDGSSRTYKITVVTSCKCKRYTRQQNDSGHKDTSSLSGKQRKMTRSCLQSVHSLTVVIFPG